MMGPSSGVEPQPRGALFHCWGPFTVSITGPRKHPLISSAEPSLMDRIPAAVAHDSAVATVGGIRRIIADLRVHVPSPRVDGRLNVVRKPKGVPELVSEDLLGRRGRPDDTTPVCLRVGGTASDPCGGGWAEEHVRALGNPYNPEQIPSGEPVPRPNDGPQIDAEARLSPHPHRCPRLGLSLIPTCVLAEAMAGPCGSDRHRERESKEHEEREDNETMEST